MATMESVNDMALAGLVAAVKLLPPGYKSGFDNRSTHRIYGVHGWRDAHGRLHIVGTNNAGRAFVISFWEDELQVALKQKKFTLFSLAPDPLLTVRRIVELVQKNVVPREWLRARTDAGRKAA